MTHSQKPRSHPNSLKARLEKLELRAMNGNDPVLENDVKSVLFSYRGASDAVVHIKKALADCPCLRLVMEDWPWAKSLVQKQTSEVNASNSDTKEHDNMAPKLRNPIDPVGRGRKSVKLDEMNFDPGAAQSILERRAPTSPTGEEELPGSSMSNPMVIDPSSVEPVGEPSGMGGEPSEPSDMGGEPSGPSDASGEPSESGGACECGGSPSNPMDVPYEETEGPAEESSESESEDEPESEERGHESCMKGGDGGPSGEPSDEPSDEPSGGMKLHRSERSQYAASDDEIVDVDPRAVTALGEEEEELEEEGLEEAEATEDAPEDVEDVSDEEVEDLGDECPPECVSKEQVLETLSPIIEQVAPGADLEFESGEEADKEIEGMVQGKSIVHELLVDPTSITDTASAEVDFLLYGENSDNPHYVVLVNGGPVAKIALSDQTLPTEHRDMFLDESYPTFVREGIAHYGLSETLKSVNARYYVAKAFEGDVAQHIQAKVASELENDRRMSAAKVKDDLINVAAIVLEGSMKNYILNNPLRDAIVAGIRKAGVHPDVAVDVVEHAWREAGVGYFTSVIQKAEEWMGAPKEVLSHHVKEITGMDYRHPGYKRAESADEIPTAVETQVQQEPETLDPYLSTASVPPSVPIRTSSVSSQPPAGDFRSQKAYWKQQMNLVERTVFQGGGSNKR